MSKQASNQFTDGLQLDMSPLIDSSKTLRNCLNGTIVTFRGDEYILQNDFGNSRIIITKVTNTENIDENNFTTGTYSYTEDSVYVQLSEGFIPIGVKVYNDVMYIASYNPETGKSELGSFPSPDYDNIQISTNQLAEENYNFVQNALTSEETTDLFKTSIADATEQTMSVYIYMQNDSSEDRPIQLIDCNQINFNSSGEKFSPQNKFRDITIKSLASTKTKDITSQVLSFDNVVKQELLVTDEEGETKTMYPDYDIVNSSFINTEYVYNSSYAIQNINISLDKGYTFDEIKLNRLYFTFSQGQTGGWTNIVFSDVPILSVWYNAPDGGNYLNASNFNLSVNTNYNQYVNLLAKLNITLVSQTLGLSEIAYSKYFPVYSSYDYLSSGVYLRTYELSDEIWENYKDKSSYYDCYITFDGLKSTWFSTTFSDVENIENGDLDDFNYSSNDFYSIQETCALEASLDSMLNKTSAITCGLGEQFSWLYHLDNSGQMEYITLYFKNSSPITHFALFDLNNGSSENTISNPFLILPLVGADCDLGSGIYATRVYLDNEEVGIQTDHNYVCLMLNSSSETNNVDSSSVTYNCDNNIYIQYFFPSIAYYDNGGTITRVSNSSVRLPNDWAKEINFTEEVDAYRSVEFNMSFYTEDDADVTNTTKIVNANQALYYGSSLLKTPSSYISQIEIGDTTYNTSIDTIPYTMGSINVYGKTITGASQTYESLYISNLNNFINNGTGDGLTTIKEFGFTNPSWLHTTVTVQPSDLKNIVDSASRSVLYSSTEIESTFVEYDERNTNYPMSIELKLPIENSDLTTLKSYSTNVYTDSLQYLDISAECINIYIYSNNDKLYVGGEVWDLDKYPNLISYIKEKYANLFNQYSGLFFKINTIDVEISMAEDDTTELGKTYQYFYLFVPSIQTDYLFSFDDNFVSNEQLYKRYATKTTLGSPSSATIYYYDINDSISVAENDTEVAYIDANLYVSLDISISAQNCFYYKFDDSEDSSSETVSKYVESLLTEYDIVYDESLPELYLTSSSDSISDYMTFRIRRSASDISTIQGTIEDCQYWLMCSEDNTMIPYNENVFTYTLDSSKNVMTTNTTRGKLFDYQTESGALSSNQYVEYNIDFIHNNTAYPLKDEEETLMNGVVGENDITCCIV